MQIYLFMDQGKYNNEKWRVKLRKNCDSIFSSFCSIITLKIHLKNQANLGHFYSLFIFANFKPFVQDLYQTATLSALLFDEY